MNDLISRQAAIDALEREKTYSTAYRDGYVQTDYFKQYNMGLTDGIKALSKLPSAHSAQPDLDEWCTDCKEYDQEKHCCPRWNRVIRNTLKNTQSEPRWIPVTEWLPKANEKDENGFIKAYLVQDARWMDVARWDGKHWVAWGYGTVLKDVIAWMPLPKPYERSEDEEMGSRI